MRYIRLLVLSLLLSFGSLQAQNMLCVDSSVFDPGQICPLVFAPVFDCDSNFWNNSCEALRYGAKACWSENYSVDLDITGACYARMSHQLSNDTLFLFDVSVIDTSDTVTVASWLKDHFTLLSTDLNTFAFVIDTCWDSVKLSLSIRTSKGCNAYCTYWIDLPDDTAFCAMVDSNKYDTIPNDTMPNDTTMDTTGNTSIPLFWDFPVSIYPNPASNALTIEGSRPDWLITITDVSGRLVYQHVALREKEIIDFSEYDSGLYFVRVKEPESGLILTRRVIKH